MSADGVWLQAELNANRSGIIVFAGDNRTSFDDFTEAFNNYSLVITDEELSQKLSLERSGNTLMTTFLSVGEFAFLKEYFVNRLILVHREDQPELCF